MRARADNCFLSSVYQLNNILLYILLFPAHYYNKGIFNSKAILNLFLDKSLSNVHFLPIFHHLYFLLLQRTAFFRNKIEVHQQDSNSHHLTFGKQRIPDMSIRPPIIKAQLQSSYIHYLFFLNARFLLNVYRYLWIYLLTFSGFHSTIVWMMSESLA